MNCPAVESPVLATIEEAIEVLKHFEFQQNPEEFNEMLKRIEGKHSILEIGSNFGGSLRRMAEVLAPHSKVVSLDLVDTAQRLVQPLHSLKTTCQKIANLGHDVKLIMGDSHSPSVRAMVEAEGPFDFIFIDGDHSYEGVKKDWEDYGPMAPMVGFHDICGGVDGCVKFWGELKKQNGYRFEEFDIPGYMPVSNTLMKLGIGIVHKDSG